MKNNTLLSLKSEKKIRKLILNLSNVNRFLLFIVLTYLKCTYLLYIFLVLKRMWSSRSRHWPDSIVEARWESSVAPRVASWWRVGLSPDWGSAAEEQPSWLSACNDWPDAHRSPENTIASQNKHLKALKGKGQISGALNLHWDVKIWVLPPSGSRSPSCGCEFKCPHIVMLISTHKHTSVCVRVLQQKTMQRT